MVSIRSGALAAGSVAADTEPEVEPQSQPPEPGPSEPEGAPDKLSIRLLWGLAGGLGVLLLATLLAHWSELQVFFPDSFDYLAVAEEGPFSFVARRPILYPVLLWALGGNLKLAILFQTAVYWAGFVALGRVAVRNLSTRGARVLALVLLFALAIQPRFFLWNSQILTESLGISLSLLAIAAWWSFAARPSRGAAALGALWTVLWVLVRDSHVIPALIALVPLALAILFWKRAEVRTRKVLAAGIVLVVVACGLAYLGTLKSDRTQPPIHNSVGMRVLTDPRLTAFFVARGMPLDDALLGRTGKDTWSDEYAFLNAPELENYRRWAHAHGSRVLAASFVAIPGYWSSHFLGSLPDLFTSGMADYDTAHVREGIPERLPIIGGPSTGPELLLWILLAGAGLAFAAAAVSNKKMPAAHVVFLITGLAATKAELFFSYSADSLEINRHAQGAVARTGVMFALTLAVGLDSFRLQRSNKWAKPQGKVWGAGFKAMSSTIGFVSRSRYLVLASTMFALMAAYTLRGRWGLGLDIWEHSAVVREMAAHLGNPTHPLLPVDRPHQFMSPYLFALALIVRVTGLQTTTVLGLAGMANLVMLVAGVWWFMTRLTGRRDAAFWALLFIFFVWGPSPWFFSGFLHFNVLALALPYPATFAKAAGILALCAQLEYTRTHRLKWLAPSVVLGAVALLAHPQDAVFLAVGLIALALVGPSRQVVVKQTSLTLGVIASWMALAALWPYYPFMELIFGESTKGYRDSNFGVDAGMYQNVVRGILPALGAIPLIVRRLIRRKWEPLLLMLAGTLVLYGFGYVTKQWHFGRLMSSIMVVVAFIFGAELSQMIERGGTGRWSKAGPRLAYAGAMVLVAVGLFNVRHGFAPVLSESALAHVPYNWSHNFVDLADFNDFDFIDKNHDKYPVVISDPYTSMSIPTYGSKVIAYARSAAFVEDFSERGADHGRFYNPATTAEDRLALAARYGANLLVVARSQLAADPQTYGPILQMGKLVSENDRFVFVELELPG